MLLVLGGPTVADAQEMSAATEKLFEAVQDGNLVQVQISVAGGADIEAVNNWGVTATDLAADKGFFDIVHFLLQARDLQSNKPKGPAAPSQVAATPFVPGEPAPMPAPAPKETTAVGEVIAPPPGSGPWSATVVTAEPPPPPPPPNLPQGPSPFDQKANNSETSLPVIGTVRGPAGTGTIIDTTVQKAVEDTFQESQQRKPKPPAAAPQPTKIVRAAPKPQQPATEPTRKTEAQASTAVAPENKAPQSQGQETGFWQNVKGFLNLETKPEDVPAPPAPKPVKKTPVASAPQAAKAPLVTAKVPVPTVQPPTDKPAPALAPIQSQGILPQRVTSMPLPSAAEDDFDAPTVTAVEKEPPAPAPAPKKPDEIDTIKVTRLSDREQQTSPRLSKSQPPETPVQIGTTTKPGKPREPENKGFFSKVISIFSSDTKEQEGQNNVTKEEDGIADWSVKEVEQAQVVPKKPPQKPKRQLPENLLEGVVLSLGRTTALGKAPPPQSPAPWYYRSCISKRQDSTVFCIEPINWPKDIKPHFLTDSVMYEGTSAIVRYDEGAASYFHTLFPTESFKTIVNYFTRRYGPPTKTLRRSIAPLGEQRQLNPTVIWQSVAPVTNLLTTLEIRKFDDNRGGFPDTKRGAVYLYHEWSQPVFPQLSSVELMLLRSEAKQR